MCAEFRSSRHLFLPPAVAPDLCGLLDVNAGTNDPDFSGLPERFKSELGMLEEADVPVPELFWLLTCFALEIGIPYSDLMALVELELGILVPGSLGLPKCVKSELRTLLVKSAELVPECLWLSKRVELEL